MAHEPQRTAWRARVLRIPEWIWTPVASAVLLAVTGGLGLWFGQPWIFPSLGPSAIQHAHQPNQPTTSLYSTIVGQACGIVAGYVAVFLLQAHHAPPGLSSTDVTGPRLASACLAIAFTALAQIVTGSFHAPGAATTLLIALGAFKPAWHDVSALAAGVLIVAVAGEVVRQARKGP